MKIVHASLFSGFGGPDLAAKWMGWENAFHCEINEFCNMILNYWFSESKSYTDVTTTDFTEWRGKVHILTGGFPCQPFSVAGQRKGADDNRYLWPHMLRAIREIQPDWVIGENVGGILTMVQPGTEVEVECQPTLFGEDNQETILEQEYVVETICRDLENEGYSVQPIVIPACSVGAPHRRDRVWFIANRNSFGLQTERVKQQTTGIAGNGTRSSSHSDSERYSSCGTCSESKEHRCGNDVKSEEWEQQTKRTDGLHGLLRNASHANGERCDNGSNHREERCICGDKERPTKKNQSEGDERKHRIGEDGTITSDTNSPELQEWLKAGGFQNKKKAETGLDDGTERFGSLQYSPQLQQREITKALLR